jgi:hypothetical protein
LSELVDYRKIHGHCNVPKKYSKNAKLGSWVDTQRCQYSLHLKGEKKSQITLPHIQALDNLGFEWEPSMSFWKGTTKQWDRRDWKGTTKKSNRGDDVTHSQLGTWVKR